MVSQGKAYVNSGEIKCGDKESVLAEVSDLLSYGDAIVITIEPAQQNIFIEYNYYKITYRFRSPISKGRE